MTGKTTPLPSPHRVAPSTMIPGGKVIETGLESPAYPSHCRASSLWFRQDHALPCNQLLEYIGIYLSKKSGAEHASWSSPILQTP